MVPTLSCSKHQLQIRRRRPAQPQFTQSPAGYPSFGPEQAYLSSIGRTERGCGATDDETTKAFFDLSRLEGIIPALESVHAVVWATKIAK